MLSLNQGLRFVCVFFLRMWNLLSCHFIVWASGKKYQYLLFILTNVKDLKQLNGLQTPPLRGFCVVVCLISPPPPKKDTSAFEYFERMREKSLKADRSHHHDAAVPSADVPSLSAKPR